MRVPLHQMIAYKYSASFELQVYSPHRHSASPAYHWCHLLAAVSQKRKVERGSFRAATSANTRCQPIQQPWSPGSQYMTSAA